MLELNKIHKIDALEGLKQLNPNSIDCVMTSPPYWALRDYGIEGQLGLEPTFDEYIKKLCNIFDEVKRVLKKEGTCWINLGDTYSGSNCGSNDYREKDGLGLNPEDRYKNQKAGKTNLPDKSLTLIPFRFAIEMINRGWILRNTIIWHKPNCMPSSAKDRFTVDFEYVFFFVKQKKYFFEAQYEPQLESSKERYRYDFSGYPGDIYPNEKRDRPNNFNGKKMIEGGRNKRTVWSICPQPFPEAHFAVYPEELCETPIKSGCPVEGIVLDPFMGAGTTALVALKQNKRFVGFEINQKYIDIANKRIRPYLEQTKLAL